MDERPSRATVAIDEGVNGLELRVGDRRLCDSRDVIAVAKLAQVL
jgi:hypothetical protein